MRQPRTRLVGASAAGGAGTLAMSAAAVANADDKIIQVNCDHGKTLKQALHKADPGDTIRVTGTCHERVTITTDRITLDGGGSAVLDGSGGGPTVFDGVVTIDGARGVTIKGFTIQNSPSWGILGGGGAAFAVKDTTMQDNGTGGIFLNSSSVEVTDVVVQHSGAHRHRRTKQFDGRFQGQRQQHRECFERHCYPERLDVGNPRGVGASQQQRRRWCRHRGLPGHHLRVSGIAGEHAYGP